MALPARVAFVITELEVGGAERCLVNLATRIDRARFEPLVISLAPRPPAGKDALVKQLDDANVPVQFLDLRSAFQFLSGIGKLTRLLRSEQPQLVQTFLFHANVVGALAARRANVPHVLAGTRVADPRWWRAWVERWACREVERFVCVSQGVADHCRSHGYPAQKLTVVPNGVDVQRFASASPIVLTELGVPEGRRVIVFVGRLDPQKGLIDLISGARHLLGKLSEHDLVLVGDGPQRAMLADLARKLGIENRVHFTGWRPDVAEILAAADALVLPSRWEGMPNVILEAMAAGKPVVTRRVEGVTEVLGDSTSEQVVEQSDVREAIADRLIYFMQNPQFAAKMGRRNQERVAAAFSIEAMVAQYDRLYVAILGL